MSILFTRYTSAILQAIFLLVLVFIGFANPADIVIIYALETMLIGVFHIFKMLVITLKGGKDSAAGFFYIPFFLVHYGMFVSIQTIFFFVFISQGDDRLAGVSGIDLYFTALQFPGVQAAGLVIIVALTLRFFIHFINGKHYENTDIKLYMFLPYPRVIIQQFVAILPGFFLFFSNGAIVAAIILIGLRLGWDLLLERIQYNEAFKAKAVRYLSQPNDEGKSLSQEEARDFMELVLKES